MYSNIVVVIVVIISTNLTDFSHCTSCPTVRLPMCKSQFHRLLAVRPGADSSAVFDLVFSSVRLGRCDQHPPQRIVVRIMFRVFILCMSVSDARTRRYFTIDACLSHISCPINFLTIRVSTMTKNKRWHSPRKTFRC